MQEFPYPSRVLSMKMLEVSRMNRKFNCKLCGKTFVGIGHMLSKGGYCCDECNWTKVLPARLKGEHL